MRVLRIIGRSIASSSRSVFRNFSLSIASITCTMITLVLVSMGILLTYNLNSISKSMEDEVTIVVFMEDKTTEEELDLFKEDLENVDNIKEITYKSKDDIMNDYAKEDDSYSKIVESWGDDNYLLDSYIITVEDIKDIDETATTIKNMDHVFTIYYGESIAKDLVKSLTFIKNSSLILVVGLVLVTAFLIGNTIKITIFSRKNEIEIMRLVGTSNSVIKMPFFFEGLLLGIVGSIIPILITIFGYDYIYNATANVSYSNIFKIIKLAEPAGIVFKTSLVLLLIGSIVGMFGSVRAVRKYLKV